MAAARRPQASRHRSVAAAHSVQTSIAASARSKRVSTRLPISSGLTATSARGDGLAPPSRPMRARQRDHARATVAQRADAHQHREGHPVGPGQDAGQPEEAGGQRRVLELKSTYGTPAGRDRVVGALVDRDVGDHRSRRRRRAAAGSPRRRSPAPTARRGQGAAPGHPATGTGSRAGAARRLGLRPAAGARAAATRAPSPAARRAGTTGCRGRTSASAVSSIPISRAPESAVIVSRSSRRGQRSTAMAATATTTISADLDRAQARVLAPDRERRVAAELVADRAGPERADPVGAVEQQHPARRQRPTAARPATKGSRLRARPRPRERLAAPQRQQDGRRELARRGRGRASAPRPKRMAREHEPPDQHRRDERVVGVASPARRP